MTDVVVVGGGPAGRALAAECAARGQATTLVDPRPDAPWRATYGAWLDDLPEGLPAPAAVARGRVETGRTHVLDRRYAVLDVRALRAHLDARLAEGGVRTVAGRVVAHTGSAVLLADGTCLRADLVIDAGGHRAPLHHIRGRRVGDDAPGDPAAAPGRHGGGHDHPGRTSRGRGGTTDDPDRASDRHGGGHDPPGGAPDDPGGTGSGYDRSVGGHGRAPGASQARGARGGTAAEQTAYGVVVDAAVAAPLVGEDEALFMDWRPEHGEPGWPTFLYAVPLGGGEVLLEETSLARRPGLPLPVLRRRLHARLAHRGIALPPDTGRAGRDGAPPDTHRPSALPPDARPTVARVERVRFPVDRPRHRSPGVLGFGAAAPLVHPASGYSVAEALRLAPAVAHALVAGGVPAAERVIWSPRARAVHRLRRVGLEALLRMPPEAVPAFFDTFFALPERHQRAYLSARDDLAGMLVAMGALFGRADARLRLRLVGPAFRSSAPAVRTVA
jgi:Lycopene cyclase protein